MPLTRKQIRAARYVAEGYRTRREVCRILRINRATIFDWLKLEEFKALVEENQKAYKQRVRNKGIASVENRVRRLNTLANKIVRVMRERAADMPGVPGGTTGLLVRRFKSIGSGATAEKVTEYEADTSLMKELRETMLQAARELGQLDAPADDGSKHERVIRTRPLKGGTVKPAATPAPTPPAADA